jgi:hypothetical protein
MLMGIDITDHWKNLVKTLFPELKEGISFEFTSPVNYNYNCLSWALGCDTHPFENSKGAFWPWKEIPDDTADGWAQVCALHGFTLTEIDNTGFVDGIEKIAILQDEDGDLHATRQGVPGIWKSKLGDMGPDIDHIGLSGIESAYGKVVRVLQRELRVQKRRTSKTATRSRVKA